MNDLALNDLALCVGLFLSLYVVIGVGRIWLHSSQQVQIQRALLLHSSQQVEVLKEIRAFNNGASPRSPSRLDV